MSGLILDIKLNDKDGGRRWVQAELIRNNRYTVIVKLPDGNIVKRNWKRDLR